MPRALCALVLSFALFQSLIAAAQAQGTQPNGLPPGVYMGEADYKQAPAGTYAVDPDHASVIARVSHLRYSWSIFRFDKVSGTLKWDPANPANSSITAKVETASITSNVKGFAQELSGNNFLKSAAFPEATFVSTRLPPDEHAARQGRRPAHADGQDQGGDVRRRAGRRRQGLCRPSAHRRQCPRQHQSASISACRRCSAIRSRS